jgi:WS/DGAT/MGAT family acyltransferase
MSSADTAWLHMDRPTNLMVINSVLLFDEPVDWERLKQTTQRRLVDRYPRFRQRVVESHLPLRAPKWEDDPEFALEHHMHHLALPAPGDAAALQELVADLMMMPLDRNRPLWQTYMVDGFGDGAAMITRMHHCIADGIALARVMLSLTDSEPDAPIEPDLDERLRSGSNGLLSNIADSGERVLALAGRVASTAYQQAGEIVLHPPHARRLAGAVVRDGSTALRLLLTSADAATVIKGDPGSAAGSRGATRSRWPRSSELHMPTRRLSTTCCWRRLPGPCAITSRTGAARSPRSRRWSRSTCVRSTSPSRVSWATSSGWCSCHCPSASAVAIGDWLRCTSG